MISCITLKNDTFKQFKIKNVNEENIYKKCGYKSSNNFSKLYTWTIDTSVELELWSKVDSASKVYNQHSIFLKYAISVNSNNKCIFLLKSNNNYINLDGKYFNCTTPFPSGTGPICMREFFQSLKSYEWMLPLYDPTKTVSSSANSMALKIPR